jgi:hypothetical protein
MFFCFVFVFVFVFLFLKLTVHSTYTEKLQRNEHIKLYTIYTSTVNRQMELAGRTNYHIYISNKFTSFLQDWFRLLVIKFFIFIILGRSIRCFGSSELRFPLKLIHSNM